MICDRLKTLCVWAALTGGALCACLIPAPASARQICVEELSGVCLKYKTVQPAKPAAKPAAPERKAAKPPAQPPTPAAPSEPNAAACLRETGNGVTWDDLAANPDAALAACQAAYRIDPTPDIAYRFGRVSDASGDLDAALPLYQEAAEAGSLPALSSLCESLAFDNLPGARAWCLKAAEAGIEGAAERVRALN